MNNPSSSLAFPFDSEFPEVSKVNLPTRQVYLSHHQNMALDWLMSGGTITDAAEYAGVARQTVTRWLKEDPEFLEIYELRKEEMRQFTRSRMLALTEKAVTTLASAMEQQRDVRAAQFILKHTGMCDK